MFKRVSPYIGEYRKYTVWATIMMSLGIIASIVPYFFLYQIISPLTRGEHIDASFILIRVAAVAVCEIIFSVSYVQGLEFSHISAYNTLKNLRVSLQGKLEKQPLGNITELGTGRIKKVFTDDIDQVELLLAHAIPEGIANIAVPVIIIILMFVFDWRLGLLSLVPLVVGMFAMGMMMKSGMEKMNAYYESAANMNNTIIEYVNGMEVVKVFNKDGDSYKRFGDVVRNYRDFTLDWYKVCWPWMAIYSSVLPCLVLLMLPFGSMMVMGGTITLDKMVLVFCMSFSVGPSVLKALNFAGKFPQLDYKIAELEKMMDHPPLKEGTSSFEGADLNVEFKDVHFGYEDTEVLHGVNLTLKQGTTTALVGPSGGGKSTIASLLARFWDVKSGRILVRGEDIRNVSLGSLMDQISMVFQRVYLFQDTVYNNIAIGRPDATKEEVEEAAKKARCYDFIMQLPEGFDTVIGEGGASLSGGEKQRISIARCILKDSPIVILDEATASVDADNERAIQEAISELCRDKTLLVIAHRLKTIKDADQILVVSGGEIIERGDHTSLMDMGGTYARMVSLQAS